MKRLSLIFLTIFFGWSAVSAQCIPEEIVSTFCRLDYEGDRTSSASYSSVRKLIVWPDIGGWDCVDIVASYDLVQSHVEGDTAVVSVKYDVIAFLAGSKLVFPGESIGKPPRVVEKEQHVHFKLVQRASCWAIARPAIRPHVSAVWALSWAEERVTYYSSRKSNKGKESYVEDLNETFEFLAEYTKTKDE